MDHDLKCVRFSTGLRAEIHRERSTLNAQRSTLKGWVENGAEVGHVHGKEEEMTSKEYDLEERLLDYAAQVIRLAERLPQTRAGNHVASQLLRSGTSALPNHGEAQAAESRNDFIHKLSICLKELKESRRWLRLTQRVPLVDSPPALDDVLVETEELIRIFAASLRTARRRTLNVER